MAKLTVEQRILVVEDKKEKKQLKKQHMQTLKHNLKNQNAIQKEKIRQNKCPNCGGVLSIRKGKYGSFYGCINYPSCRFTKNMS